MSDKEAIEKLLSEGELLTCTNGPLAVTEDQRQKIAVFRNGSVFLVSGFNHTSEYHAIRRAAQGQLNLTLERNNFTTVSVPFLQDLYKRAEAAGEEEEEERTELTLERQKQLKDLIERAAREGSSDIHLRVVPKYTEVRNRVYGRLKDLTSMAREDGLALVNSVFAHAVDTVGNAPLDFHQGALTTKSGLLPPKVEMIRLQYSPTSDSRGALVMRLKYVAPANETEIDTLGYNDRQIEAIKIMRTRTNGLYILAGKVSSGKSTTLQRVLNKMYLEKHAEISIFTIEEPVELDLPSAIQVPAKKTPSGSDGFEAAMKSSLRSDPNIIVLGEIRSHDLAHLAIQAVMTGHALWSTVHAGTALGILDRLTDLKVESWKLADPTVVRGLVYQRLTGVLCPHCRITFKQGVEQGSLREDLRDQLTDLFGKSDEELYVRGPGCEHCKLGLSGRTVVAETVLTDPTMLALFAAGKRIEMREHWIKPVEEGGMGGTPVLHHALSKVGAGLCDVNEVEEEVDLVDVYTKDMLVRTPSLKERLRADVRDLELKRAQKK